MVIAYILLTFVNVIRHFKTPVDFKRLPLTLTTIAEGNIMRLSKENAIRIKTCVNKVFGENMRVFLFGSRIDDTKRGGDIDLYLLPENAEIVKNCFNKKIDLLVALEKTLGEQKIDIVIAKTGAEKRLIDNIALRDGIEL